MYTQHYLANLSTITSCGIRELSEATLTLHLLLPPKMSKSPTQTQVPKE